MICLDTSVVLAHLFAEDRPAPADLWERGLVSSRLLEYEVWVAAHRRGASPADSEAVRETLARVAFLALDPAVLVRAAEPFPVPVRTLAALHLASALFLRGQGQPVALLTFDHRMAAAAAAVGLDLHETCGA